MQLCGLKTWHILPVARNLIVNFILNRKNAGNECSLNSYLTFSPLILGTCRLCMVVYFKLGSVSMEVLFQRLKAINRWKKYQFISVVDKKLEWIFKYEEINCKRNYKWIYLVRLCLFKRGGTQTQNKYFPTLKPNKTKTELHIQ